MEPISHVMEIIIKVKFLKFRTWKKNYTMNLFSLLTIEAKGSNKFCKGRSKIGYFPHRVFGIFLYEIKIVLYKFLEHLP